MTKRELAVKLAKELDITQANANQYINFLFDSIKEEVAKGEKVQIAGFGTFEAVETKARNGINPRTGETIEIKAKKKPKFKATKDFKEFVENN